MIIFATRHHEPLTLNHYKHMEAIIPQLTGYIDPGTGSIILQAIAAGIIGGAVAVRLFWHRILTFFRLKKRNKQEADKSE